MLSWRTASAKLKQTGGPVSRPVISIAMRAGLRKTSGAYSRRPINSHTIGFAMTDFATVARMSLQQGIFAAGFFFAGAECIGQPLISAVDSVERSNAPSAQWLERKVHAPRIKSVTAQQPAAFTRRRSDM